MTDRIEFPYMAFYEGKQFDLYASSLLDAKEKAVKHFKPPKSKKHMVHVYLALVTA